MDGADGTTGGTDARSPERRLRASGGGPPTGVLAGLALAVLLSVALATLAAGGSAPGPSGAGASGPADGAPIAGGPGLATGAPIAGGPGLATGAPIAGGPAGSVGPPVVRADPPVAEFEYTPAQPEVGTRVRFDAGESADPDGIVVRFEWDFDGDGVVDRNATVPEVEHVYESTGTYEVTLTVVDDDGETDTTTRRVDVEAREPRPTAACSVSPTRVATGEEVVIDATGTENAEAVRFDVDGDGTEDRTATDEFRVSVGYDTPGEYSPAVTAIGDGVAEATCGTVVVTAGTPEGTGTGTGTGGDGGGPGWLLPALAVGVALVAVAVAVAVRYRRRGAG